MLIFDQDLEDLERRCEFRVTKNTKNFLVCFFGFYPYSISNRFESFILETGVVDLANHHKIGMECFELNGDLGIEVHDQCGGGTFDPSIVLPQTFKSEEDALNWFDKKLKDSINLSKNEICSINVLDGDKLIRFIERKISKKNKKNTAKTEINKEIKEFKKSLLEKYQSNKIAVELIHKKIHDID